MTRSIFDPGQSKGRHYWLSGSLCFLLAITLSFSTGCGKKESEDPAAEEPNVVTPLNIEQPGDDDDSGTDEDASSADGG